MNKVIFPTAKDDQGTRKSAFGSLFISLASHLGYTQGNSLKVPGSYCFEFHKDGRVHRIGMKTAWDRFINTAFVMGQKVDEVWVFTIKWNDEEGDDVDWRPEALQVYSIGSKKLAELYDKVHTARAKSSAGKKAPYAFIPLDEDELDNPKLADFDKAAGHLTAHMKLIFEAPLVFSDRGAPRIESTPDAPEPIQVTADPSQGIRELVFQHKEALAKIYGTTADKVKIHVEV